MTLPKVFFCSAGLYLAGTFTAVADQVVPATGPIPENAQFVPPIRTDILPVTASVQAPAEVPSLPSSEFVPLIRGEGLEGWVVHEGKAFAWNRADDMISCTSAAGGWLRTEAEYSDFELRLEYRMQAGGNTGVGLRTPSTGNPTFTSLEVQLLDDSSPKYADLRPDQYTGSIYYQVPATKRANLKPTGEWNQCVIICRGDLVTISINGEVINEVALNRQNQEAVGSEQPKPKFSLSQRPPLGHIALQSHSTQVDFRKIEIKDLSVATPSGLRYVELAGGEGEALGDQKQVTVHYVGQLPDGKRFTDTRDLGSPVTVPIANVIPGWIEGMQGMKVGSRRRLIVPPRLAYGEAGVQDLIPPNSMLVFEIELYGFEN